VELKESVAAYRAALEERTRERAPLDWAMTQNNLGLALSQLGEWENTTEILEEAIATSRAALDESARERVHLQWAKAQNNLGLALLALGNRESGTDKLVEAVAAYRAAGAGARSGSASLGPDTDQSRQCPQSARRAGEGEPTREGVPLDWAAIQNSLGNALAALDNALIRVDAQETGMMRLWQGAEAYRSALKEHRRDRVPLLWATTQNNLGAAALGDRRAGERNLAARGVG
jgi:tetratricopeptide (TPR) repeat protein